MDIDRSSRQNPDVPSRKTTFWRALLGVAVATWLAAASSVQAEEERGWRDQRRRLIAMRVSQILDSWLSSTGGPGLVIALVEEGTSLVVDGAGGTGTGDRIDPDKTLFRVGDLVRPLTATALLRLSDRGQLNLDADLAAILTRSSLPRGEVGPLTARQLLLHTAGLDYRVARTRARRAADALPLERYIACCLPPRVRSPGALSLPSGHGYALAGLVLERVSGKTFAEALAEEVFAVLRMQSSTVAPTALSAPDMATGHHLVGGRTEAVESTDLPQAAPAGFLLTTGRDMSRWLEVVTADGLDEGERVLSAGSIDALSQRQFSNHPELPGRTIALREGRIYYPPELYLAWTGNGFSALVMMLPEQKIGLFVAANNEADLWMLAYAVLDQFGHRRKPEPSDNRAIDPVPVEWDRYTGYWREASTSLSSPEKLLSLVRQQRLSRAEDDSLRWGPLSFDPLAPDVFRLRDGHLELRALAGSTPLRIAMSDGRILEKLTLLESRPVQVGLWVLFPVLLLGSAWPRSTSGNKRPGLMPRDAFEPRWPETLTRLAACIDFVFVTAMAVLIATLLRSPGFSLVYGIPLVVWPVLSLPIIGATLTLAALPGLARALRSPHWSLRRRLRLTFTLLLLIAFLPFLASWNLLGFHL